MIKINNLSFIYPGALGPALNHISLQIEKGDFVAIIGNNGCGKSTLCKALNGLIPNFIVGDMEGTIEIEGKDTKSMEIGDIALKIGYVYQDFENQIVCPKVIDDASYACLNYAHANYKEEGKNALRVCGLEDKAQDYIWQMSGGQKHLLALAGVAALSPDVFILDEPIAQLDPVHAKQIYDVLRDLNRKHNKTIIVIEHHTEFIAEYCNHVILMKSGEIKWKLDTKTALRRVDELKESSIFPPQITVAAHILQKLNVLDKLILLPVSMEEGKKLFETILWKEKVKTGMDIRLNQAEDIVRFEHVYVKYPAVKGKPEDSIKNLSLAIKKGEKIALIGSNGAGKSTLMKLMTGLVKASLGEVFLKNQLVNQMNTEEISNLISLVYQNPEEMFIQDSIGKDIEYAMKSRNIPNYERRKEELLDIFQLEGLADQDGRLLSGGQMRRASLAIGIALEPGILLLDEPTANLDIATRREIMKILLSLKNITDTVIIATYDMQLVCDWADRIIVLENGTIVADGAREEIFGNEYIKAKSGIKPPEIVEMCKLLNRKQLSFTIRDFVSGFLPEDISIAAMEVLNGNY